MKKLILLLKFCIITTITFSQTPIIHATTKSVDIKDGKWLRKTYWYLDTSIKNDIYKTRVKKGESKKVTFYTDIDSISFNVFPEQKYNFIILLNGKDTCRTQINTIIDKIDIEFAPYRVDTSNVVIKEILEAYKNYYWEEKNIKKWNKYEAEKYQAYDLGYQHIVTNVIKDYEKYYEIFIMSIDSIYDSNKYQIKALLSHKNGLSGEGFLISIIHKITAFYEDGKVVFENNAVEMIKDWENTTYGNIDYTYHPSYNFDENLAKNANRFIDSIRTVLKLPLLSEPIEYVLARDFDEFANLQGFEYYSFVFTTGITAIRDNRIMTTKGPFHAHELVHLAVTDYKLTFILHEGSADYLGTRLTEWDFYIQKMNLFKDYLKSSDEEMRYYFEGPLSRNYKYSLGAYLCEYIVKNHGIDKLIYLLELDTDTDNTLLENIAKTTGLSEDKFLIDFESFIFSFKIERN